ncbi:LbetaH domain-containing protein [Tautonia plasticadhaerens]|uniref:sugar O-acyltransferase n=1 Tax=Tautonia plasticadhaerens TaxID=2527974 RepID=UPI001E38F75F|nr:sugar O-acyltransferase [Tautonia plasticadhaerens]
MLDAVQALNAVRPTFEPIGFLDDVRPSGTEHLGLSVLGPLTDAARFSEALLINAIGSDQSYARRPAIVASTGLPPDRFATIVHPGASVSSHARLGCGVLIAFGASVGGGATVGDHATLCPLAIVGHDATIGPHALLAPGAIVSGHARLGEACYVGAGATVRQLLIIGAAALVGMGAVVTRDVAERAVVWGSPARRREAAR